MSEYILSSQALGEHSLADQHPNSLFLHAIQFYESLTTPVWTITAISFLWLYFTGSFFFDAVHYLLHQCSKSRHWALRCLGDLHLIHHLYFNRKLKFNNKYRWHNLFIEVPLELACQLVGNRLGWLVAKQFNFTGPEKMTRELFYLVGIIQIIRSLVVCFEEGADSNHITYSQVPKDPNWLVVGPEFHALHHVHPDRYMASAFRVFDWVFGTSSSFQSKRIAITGANGAFGRALKKKLLSEKVACIKELKFGVDWTYEDYSALIPILRNSDILILAHGAKGDNALAANCHAPTAIINLFKEHRMARPGFEMDIPEIWYTGSEIELHPSWGIPSLQVYSHSKRAFLPFARLLYDDPAFLYRHIVPSAFSSPMGPAILSADWAATVAMWWIHRGARYVPVTYTGIAFVNFFKFLFWVKIKQTLEKKKSV